MGHKLEANNLNEGSRFPTPKASNATKLVEFAFLMALASYRQSRWEPVCE